MRLLRRKQLPPLEVTLYRRPGCGLCDEAESMLARIGKKVPLSVTAIDIDTDPDLQARYFLEIPVVLSGETELARAPISERTLEATLRTLLSLRPET